MSSWKDMTHCNLGINAHVKKSQFMKKLLIHVHCRRNKAEKKKSCKPEDKHMSSAAVSLSDSLKIWWIPSHHLWTKSNKEQSNVTQSPSDEHEQYQLGNIPCPCLIELCLAVSCNVGSYKMFPVQRHWDAALPVQEHWERCQSSWNQVMHSCEQCALSLQSLLMRGWVLWTLQWSPKHNQSAATSGFSAHLHPRVLLLARTGLVLAAAWGGTAGTQSLFCQGKGIFIQKKGLCYRAAGCSQALSSAVSILACQSLSFVLLCY